MDILTPDNLKNGGILIALIYSMWLNYKVVSNHINHNTESTNHLEQAITRLTQFLTDKIK